MANQGLPDTQLVIVAVLLLLLGGLFAMTDSSLQRVSAARVTEMVRDGVRGAKALQAILGDRLVRHLNLLLLLRVFCELGATTLVALVVFDSLDTQWLSALIVAGSMTILTFVVVASTRTRWPDMRRRSCAGWAAS
jgi:Mg2+/Co2+ transporter CorB